MVRIIEQDRLRSIRGCHEQQMVCFSTANSLFVSNSQMTYKSFVSFAYRLAKYFNAGEMVIQDIDPTRYLITVCELKDDTTGEYSYVFWHEPDDAKSVEDRIYYSKEDFQKTQELKRKTK